MANPNGKCVVCGSSPTVKAHLFPRALMLDLKSGSPQLVSAEKGRPGIRLKQNGEWDDRILCDTHEKSLGNADDYGIRFCRAAREATSRVRRGNPTQVPNSEPEKLLRFAYAIVWRHQAACGGRQLGPQLGPYGRLILNALLNDGPYDLEMLVSANPLTLNGEPVHLGIAPYTQRFAKFRTVHFAISGLDFYLKTDKQPFPIGWRPFLANGNNPVTLTHPGERGIHQAPILQPLLSQMSKSPWKGPK